MRSVITLLLLCPYLLLAQGDFIVLFDQKDTIKNCKDISMNRKYNSWTMQEDVTLNYFQGGAKKSVDYYYVRALSKNGELFIPEFARNFPIDSATGYVIYTGVVEVNMTKDALYSRAKEWFVNTFKDSKEVIQLDDKEKGQIIGKGSSFIASGVYSRYTVKISVKEGKYKYEIKDISVGDIPLEQSGISDKNLMENRLKDGKVYRMVYKNQCEMKIKLVNDINSLIPSLKAYMSAPDKASADW